MTERKANSAGRQKPSSPVRGKKWEVVLDRETVPIPVMQVVFAAENDAKLARLRPI